MARAGARSGPSVTSQLRGRSDGAATVATFGEQDSLAMLKAAEPSPAEIGVWCERNGVDAWFRYGGDLAVTTNPEHEGRWNSTIEAAARLGAADRFEVLSPEQVHAR